jgi:hypothetical protein
MGNFLLHAAAVVVVVWMLLLGGHGTDAARVTCSLNVFYYLYNFDNNSLLICTYVH